MNYNSSNINQSMDIQSLMKSFLKTLNPKEQREFLREFKTLTPEEQNEFYEALIAQASGQQGMQQGMQMQEGGEAPPKSYGGNQQTVKLYGRDWVKFDSNKAKKNPDGTLTIFASGTGEKYNVKRNKDGSYDFVNPSQVAMSAYSGNTPGNYTAQDSAYQKELFNKQVNKTIDEIANRDRGNTTINSAALRFLGREINPEYIRYEEGPHEKLRPRSYSPFIPYPKTLRYDTIKDFGEDIRLLKVVDKGDTTKFRYILTRPNESPVLKEEARFLMPEINDEDSEILTGNPTKGYRPSYEQLRNLRSMQEGGQIDPMALFEQYLASLPEQTQDEIVMQLEALPQDQRMQIIMSLVESMNQPQMQKGAPSSGGRFFQPRTPSSYGTRTSYQEGGQSQMVPIEVEGGETVKLPNGKLEKFTGPKHAEGGIPTQLPEGALIFSEHLKAPKEVVDLVMGKGKNRKKKYSYADLSKKYPTKPYERKLESPDYDQFEKQAASIKLQNNKAMLETIFAAQEMDKAMKGKPNDLQTAMGDTQMPMAKYGKLLKFQNAGKVDSKSSQWWLAPGLSHRFDQPVTFFSEENLREPAPSSWWTLKPSDFTEEDFYTYKEYAQQRDSAYKEGFPGLYPQEQPEPSPAQPQNRPSSQRRSPLPTNLVEMWDPQNIDLISREYDVTLPNASLYDADTKSYRRSGTVGLDAPGPTEYEVDATIPSLQRSRGKRVYGEQDWTSEPLMNDFKARHAEFFEQNPNWDPTRPSDTKKFQEWYEEQNPGYFRDKGGFRGFDDKFGQYTWSAPSVKKRAPQAAPEPAAPLPNRSAAIDSPLQPLPSSQPMQPAAPAAKKKNPLGISRQLSGSIFDFLMAASDNLDIDAPQFRDNRKNPLFTRYVDFEDEDVNKMYNQSMMQIMNSNMPEQVKQSQIANLNSKLQEFQGKEDFARYQNYQQKLGLDTEKLQKYMDTNIDQQSADIERYREKMGRINDLRNQFRAQKKARMVNPVRQFLDYVQKVDLQNQIYADQFKVNPYTGKVTFTEGKQQNALDQQATNMNQYGKVGEVSVLGSGVYIQNTKYGPILIQDGKATPITPIDMPSQGSKKSSRQTAAEILEGQ